MVNLWRAIENTEGCWERLKSFGIWLLLNAVWVVLLWVACDYGDTSWELYRHGESVEATVIALEESRSTEGSGVTYAPVVKYDVGGQTYTFTSSNSSSPPSYEVGERVALRYDPADPAWAQIDSWTELWLLPLILGATAVIVAVVVNLLMFASIRRRRTQYES